MHRRADALAHPRRPLPGRPRGDRVRRAAQRRDDAGCRGRHPTAIVAVGGGTQGALWTTIVSDVTGLDAGTSRRPPSGRASAPPSSRRRPSRRATATPRASRTGTRSPRSGSPTPSVRAAYDELYALYRALYDDSASVAHALAAIQQRPAVPRSERGLMPRVLDASASAAAFPLGGIGTGNVSIGARGELRDWELVNLPRQGRGATRSRFFAIHAAPVDGAGRDPGARGARTAPPHEGDQGYYAGDVAGLPRLADTPDARAIPAARARLPDERAPGRREPDRVHPVRAARRRRLRHPRRRAALPVHNPRQLRGAGGDRRSLGNPIGSTDAPNVFHFPEIDGRPRIEARDEDGLRGLGFDIRPARRPPRLRHRRAHDGRPIRITAKPQWLFGFWQDGVQLFWDDLRADGRLRARAGRDHGPRSAAPPTG